jgi:uncharacterized repeat protein (TIGR02543 family)
MELIMKELPYLKITFDTNGARHIPGIMIRLGIKIPRPKDPVREGYIFAGWYRDCRLKHKWEFCTIPRYSMELYAKWVKNEITEVMYVVFDAAGGSPVPPVQRVKKGECASIPVPEPKKEKYIFGGWYTSAGKLFDFSTRITQDMTLTAHWSEVPVQEYTVTFDAQGGTPTPTAQNIPDGGKVTVPTEPTKEDFTFDGWFTEGGELYDFDTEVHSSFTLTAHWSEVPVQEYTVTFDAQGGSPAPTAQNIPDGGKVTVPTEPTKEDFTFDGWFTEGGELYDFDTEVHSSFTLTAHWSEVPVQEFTVTFDAQGGSPTPTAQTIPDGGKVQRPPDPTRNGYIFTNWYTEAEGGTAYDFDEIVHGSFTLYARWVDDEGLEYVVAFVTDGGSKVPYQLVTIGSQAQQPDDPTKDGFAFAGWFDYDGNQWDFATPITTDTILYAHWSELSAKRGLFARIKDWWNCEV